MKSCDFPVFYFLIWVRIGGRDGLRRDVKRTGVKDDKNVFYETAMMNLPG